jgi:hypothetical protein
MSEIKERVRALIQIRGHQIEATVAIRPEFVALYPASAATVGFLLPIQCSYAPLNSVSLPSKLYAYSIPYEKQAKRSL